MKVAVQTGDPEILGLTERYLDLLNGQKAEQSFRHFVTLFWPVVANTPLRGGYYLDALCDHLQNLPTIRRLAVAMPPRHGKSTIISVLYPAYRWVTHPETKFLCSSYSLQLADRDSVYCRTVIKSPLYQHYWGDKFKLLIDQDRKDRFETDKRGMRLATSVNSPNTGEGCDCLLADDLNDVSKVNSDLERAKVIRWWTQVMASRMNPRGLDCKVVVQQRCHEEDIIGYLLSQAEDEWVRLILPLEFDPDRKTVTPLWTDPRTEPGELLSDLLTAEKIAELKGGNGLGPLGFACQYNQRPAPAEGNLFKRSWFGGYAEGDIDYVLEDGRRVVKKDCWRMAVADLADTEDAGDYTVIQIWDVTAQGDMILVTQFRDRLAPTAVLDKLKQVSATYHPAVVGIEEINHVLTIDLLRRDGIPVRAMKHRNLSKESRSITAQSKAASGQVWLPSGPEDKEWVAQWLEEVTVFPNGRHDDVVDALSYSARLAWEQYQVGVKPLRVERKPCRIYGPKTQIRHYQFGGPFDGFAAVRS